LSLITTEVKFIRYQMNIVAHGLAKAAYSSANRHAFDVGWFGLFKTKSHMNNCDC